MVTSIERLVSDPDGKSETLMVVIRSIKSHLTHGMKNVDSANKQENVI